MTIMEWWATLSDHQKRLVISCLKDKQFNRVFRLSTDNPGVLAMLHPEDIALSLNERIWWRTNRLGLKSPEYIQLCEDLDYIFQNERCSEQP